MSAITAARKATTTLRYMNLEYTGINEFEHLCAECLKDINEDKELCVVKGVIKVKDKKNDKRAKNTKPSE